MTYNPRVVLAFFKEMGLPPAVTECEFAKSITYIDKRGKVRFRGWRFDFAWLEPKIALEVEGGIWIGGGHSRGSGVSKDIAKYNAAILLGWRVLRVVPKDLCKVETTAMIHKAFKL